MTSKTEFRISAALKDLIGRGLITSDFVAVSELVKNSFDAHAKTVQVLFEENKIVICDDGKGMSRDDILSKWLFVAYSAKREGTEDDNYRHKMARPFAGSKGVGRFSCDRLGRKLRLVSRAEGENVQVLVTDWTKYEEDATQEFGNVTVEHSEQTDFPESLLVPTGKSGTALEITSLRSDWDRKKLLDLKGELSKLINPFAIGPPRFQIRIIAEAEKTADAAAEVPTRKKRDTGEVSPRVNGWVENPILSVLAKRTTTITVRLTDGGRAIESSLEDRGDLVYRIKEPNEFTRLRRTGLEVQVYFLNRGAKSVFKRRMGLHSVEFGSIFLYRNGFRVYPIGEERDDFFGLGRRKQQGMRRFLGSRDVIGRVEIRGVRGFDEATSRDQGLIRTPEVEDLIRFLREKCVVRLERYVVDITWKDEYDQWREDTARIRLDRGRALVTELVARLADTADVELLEYNRELVRMLDERSEEFEKSLGALELLAERTGDKALQARVREAKARLRALEKAESDARAAQERAEERARVAEDAAATAEAKFRGERERNQFLVAASSLDQDTVLNLHHQIAMHSSDVHIGVRRMMRKLRGKADLRRNEWVDFLERVAFRNSQILTATRFATKRGYKQQASEVEADLPVYIIDYIATVTSLWAPRGVQVRLSGTAGDAVRKFRPIEVGIVVDNLVSNAAKAQATHIEFRFSRGKGPKPDLEILVADDGLAWSKELGPIESVFEKGVTTTSGSGLGLFHVKQVIERLGGSIEALSDDYSGDVEGAKFMMRVPI